MRKTIVGILSFLAILWLLPSSVAALQTALVRTNNGGVYQIRFRNIEPRRVGYGLGDFIDDFSIYDQSGRVKLCPGNDREVTWELYTAARILAKTPRKAPIFDTSVLSEALEKAVEDQNLKPTQIADKLVYGEIVGQLQSHTFLEHLSLVPKSGPAAIIVVPAAYIAKFGNVEIKLRRLLYAFWIASTHADTAIVLQEIANQKAAELWDAINAGEIIDTFGGELDVDIGSGELQGGISIDLPLRLRLMAEVYQRNAEKAAELGGDLGKDGEAWSHWMIGLTGIGDLLQLILSPLDALLLKDALSNLEDFSGELFSAKLKGNIENIYDSAKFDLDWHGFCKPDIIYTASYLSVYEGYDLTYTVALNSPPDGVAIITIRSDNSDATVSPDLLRFTSTNWYMPRTVRIQTIEDADSLNDRVYLTHTATEYGDIRPQELRFTIKDRRGNEFPESVKPILPVTLLLGENLRLNLAEYFRDPDGDQLSYAASDELSDVVDALSDRSGSWITLKPRKIGSAQVKAWATDPDGLSVLQIFDVSVTAADTEDTSPQPPTPEGLSKGVPIIVQNTGRDGLNIRSDPEVRNQNPDNRIGIAYEGATGTITAGPQIDTEGRTWWEVKWDVSNKVQWQHQPANHRGWSVEAIGETGLLVHQPPEPVTQSFDLAIEAFTISKDTLAPNESFTLSVRIHNKGPGDSPGPALSYYHSSIQGLTIEDRPQLQGTVLLDPLKAGERITKLIPLEAPSTPRTYYYGAWLAANYGDTDIYNDVATEVGVIVSDTVNARVQLIYWTEDNKIYQSLSDGTARKVVLIRAGKRLGRLALDVSGRKMYWTEFPVSGGTTTLKRANLDGSGIENVVVNIGALTDLLLDTSNSQVYWAAIIGRFEGNKIRRSNLNGSQIQDLVTDLNPADFAKFELIESLALDASSGKMYWAEAVYERQADNTLQITNTGKIQRSNLNGSRIEDLLTGISSRAIALDVFDGKLYWINNHASKLQRANLDGSQVEDLVSTPNMETHFFLSLDVSSGKMYWGSSHIILRANLDGTEAEILYQVTNPFNNIIGDIVFAILPEDAVHAAPSTTSTMLATTAPTKTSILPNYPNPFNPETWMPYQLAKSADVSVSIYSIDGKLVRTLAFGHQAAGVYQSKSRAAHWDGRNELGEHVASGLYFYTFTAGDFTATRKMLIQK